MSQAQPITGSLPEEEAEARRPPTRRRSPRLRGRDRATVILFVAVPTLFVLFFVWLPAIGSVILSFGNWSGIGPLSTIQWVAFQNYEDIATIYPPFWPAIQHNVIWLVFLFLVPTTLGMLFAVVRCEAAASTRAPSSCRWSCP